jgi:LysR family transcriptional regulator, regulator for bpeEF and oprC
MGEFFDRHPSISVELLNFDQPANLIEEGIDVAIHSGDLSDSSLIARKIAETSVVLVATPEYLRKHGTPKHPNQLRQHRTVAYMHQGAPRPWVFKKNPPGLFTSLTATFAQVKQNRCVSPCSTISA